jgi:hypothetical protein
MTRTTNRTADENSCQLRSRLAQRLNVPDDVRLAPSLAAALLDNCFDRPQIVSSQPTPVSDLIHPFLETINP